MSSVASAFVVPVQSLQDVANSAVPRKTWLGGARDEFRNTLASRGAALPDYAAQGYVLATLLCFLEDRGFQLMNSDHDALAAEIGAARKAAYFVITDSHRARFLEALRDSSFEREDLRKYYEEFNEVQAPGVEEAMLEGVSFIVNSLSATSTENVVLLEIA